jgi:hypothetical protein
LEQAENDIVEVELPLLAIVSLEVKVMEEGILTRLWYPIRCVQSPTIPQSEIRTLKRFVTRNMLLVRNLKYFWIYQNPKVEVIEHTACVMPR